MVAAAILSIGLQGASGAGSGRIDTTTAAAGLAAGGGAGVPADNTLNGSDPQRRSPTALPDLSPYDDGLRAPLPAPESRLTGFDQYRGADAGGNTGLWLTQQSSEIKGLGTALSPGRAELSRLALYSTFLQQHAPTAAEAPSSKPNNVWGVGLMASLWDRQLKFHSEYAASRRATADTSADVGGDAYDLHLAFQPQPVELRQSPVNWQVSLDRRAADPRFWTLGDAPGGQLTERISGELSWQRFSSNLAYSRSRPRAGTATNGDWHQRRLSARVHYAAEQMQWLPLDEWLLGQSNYTVHLERARYAEGVPSRLDTASLLASFNPGPWRWQLSHTRSLGFDDAESAIQRRAQSSIGLHLPLPGRWVLNPSLFRNRERPLRVDDTQHSVGGELLAAVVILPHRLNARFQVNTLHNRHEAADATENQTRLESVVDWKLRPRRGSAPRITLSLDGWMESRDLHGSGEADETRYRVFARFEAAWPDA